MAPSDEGRLPADAQTALIHWLSGRGLAPASPLHRLAGGTQNVMLAYTSVDGDRLVVRHPPLGRSRDSDRMIQRETAVLELLDGTDVPHARLRAVCLDRGPTGSAFYVMDEVAGLNPGIGLSGRYARDSDWQWALGIAMAQSLALLAHVGLADVRAAGLRCRDDWHERQPDRWWWQIESYGESHLAGPGQHIVSWLKRHPPHAGRLGLIHGDYHLGNVLIDPDRPRVVAIVDWELAAIGDPRLDLAHLLAGWPVGNPGSIFADLHAEGLPSAGEMRTAYGAVAPPADDDQRWFDVLARLRLATILEGSHLRAKRGEAPAQTGLRLHRLSEHLMDAAVELVSGR